MDLENLRRLSPLGEEAGFRRLVEICEHADAPRWTNETGDKLSAEELGQIRAYAARLGVSGQTGLEPPEWLGEWIASLLPHVPLFQQRVPADFSFPGDFPRIEPMERLDLVLRLADVVPVNADLEKLVRYGTSGTTGHPVLLPHHPLAVAHYQAFISHALSRYGISADFQPGDIAGYEICYQQRTVTFATVLSFWNSACFAKVNLQPDEWPSLEARGRFFESFPAKILTGDPISFAYLRESGIRVKPACLISTALSLTPALKREFEEHFRCPVIDWYSLNETGPIGYTCRENSGYHLLPPDLYVEILDDENRPLPAGERGQLAVSGGRNPYLPLLRYLTGFRPSRSTIRGEVSPQGQSSKESLPQSPVW